MPWGRVTINLPKNVWKADFLLPLRIEAHCLWVSDRSHFSEQSSLLLPSSVVLFALLFSGAMLQEKKRSVANSRQLSTVAFFFFYTKTN